PSAAYRSVHTAPLLHNMGSLYEGDFNFALTKFGDNCRARTHRKVDAYLREYRRRVGASDWYYARQNTMGPITCSLVLLILTACSQNTGSNPTVPVPSFRPAQVSMAASEWQFQYSSNVPKNPTAVSTTAWEFNLPVDPSDTDGVHYLVTTSPILTGKSTLTMSGLIT